MNCADKIKKELKCMDEIKRKWWVIVQKQKWCKLNRIDQNGKCCKFNGTKGVCINNVTRITDYKCTSIRAGGKRMNVHVSNRRQSKCISYW